MRKNQDNKVHIHGFINEVKAVETKDGNKQAFFIKVGTKEAYKQGEEWKEKFSNHNVSVVTDDQKVIEQLNAIGADCEANRAHQGEEGYKKVTHEASFDGILITRENEKEGVKYYNQIIISDVEGMSLDCKQGDKEVRNTAEFKGNIANVDIKDDFAVIQIATRYYAPGEGTNFKGETKPYHEETSYVETRISKNYRPETFEKLKSGEIAVGDLIKARGQMHNNNFEDKNGVSRYKIVVDLNNVDLVAKKGQKKAEAEEVKEAPKVEKKAKKATSRKKGQTL